MTSTVQFPCVLPIWCPPLPTSVLWKNQTTEFNGSVDPHDMLVAVALGLCQQGSPEATFYIALPYGSLQVAFPSINDNPSLGYWRPELVRTSTHALVALRLNHNLSSYDLVELAVSLSVPLLISQRSDVNSTYIQATYDDTAVSQSQAAWFLIHVTNALRSLRTNSSRSLQSNMLLFGATERFLFSDNVLTRLLPPWLLFYSANALRSLRVQSNRDKISDVPLVSPSERILLGGEVVPRHQPFFWDEHPHESLLHDLFLERARVDPLSIVFRSHHAAKATAAIVEVTYATCYAIALRLALELLSAGVQANSVVPIILVHPMDIAISMIAVLLAGSSYAVMDPNVSDVAGLQKCLRLRQLRSPVVLMHHALHDQFKCLDVYSIDPRDVIQRSLQDPWECDSSIALPTVVGGDIAFVTSSSHQWDVSVVTYVTHTDATDRLRACFENLDITSMSKVLLMNDCPGFLFQRTIWNVLAHGGAVCSIVELDYDAPFLQTLYNLQCTHVALPTSHLTRVSLALTESLSMADGAVCDHASALPLHTLIVPDDPPARSVELMSRRGIKIIKYNDDESLLEKKPEITDVENMDVEIIFYSENDVGISPVEVLALLPSGLVLHSMGSKVVKIRDDLAVKYGSCVLATEAHNMTFVREHTDILVPCVHLVFRQNHHLYIVMQYIDGCTLEHQWDILDESTRATMLSQLTGYLCQLRALKSASSTPGPVDKTACRGQWFTIFNAGPFQTHAELVEWLNHKVDISHNSAEAFSDNHQLVFTHQDLAPRNFILDKTNQLWIIDWEFAGWYPAYFEYACVASLLHSVPNDRTSQVLPCLGPYEREYHSLQAIAWVLDVTPFA